jgi:putative membrane protein
MDATLVQIILSLPFILVLVIYLTAVIALKQWLYYRTLLWIGGSLCAVAAVAGPLAVWSHHNFSIHMISHLLLGMLAPLLMVLAAPMTLLFGILSTKTARILVGILKSRYLRVVCNPIVASVLNIGGLWVLYSSDLFSAMHQSTLLFAVVHLHIFLAGYVFTASMIYIDPAPHRTSFIYRAIVMVMAFAGHGILAKYIYAHPPRGVPVDEAEMGGMLMYYGGDVVDLVLIIVFCWQWYKAARPRVSMKMLDQQFLPELEKKRDIRP